MQSTSHGDAGLLYHIWLAYLHVRLGRLIEGQSLLDQVATRESEMTAQTRAALHFARATALIATGDSKGAEAALKQSLDLASDQLYAWPRARHVSESLEMLAAGVRR